MQKITPFLWFNTEAEEAAKLYVSLFKDAKIVNVVRYNEAVAQASGQQAGTAMTVTFELEGQQFVALNGGPQFAFTEAVSFAVDCETQEEIDMLWSKLTEGGSEGRCGWLKDRYGLSWQIVPRILPELLNNPDPTISQRVTMAMMQMKKLNIDELKKALEG